MKFYQTALTVQAPEKDDNVVCMRYAAHATHEASITKPACNELKSMGTAPGRLRGDPNHVGIIAAHDNARTEEIVANQAALGAGALRGQAYIGAQRQRLSVVWEHAEHSKHRNTLDAPLCMWSAAPSLQ